MNLLKFKYWLNLRSLRYFRLTLRRIIGKLLHIQLSNVRVYILWLKKAGEDNFTAIAWSYYEELIDNYGAIKGTNKDTYIIEKKYYSQAGLLYISSRLEELNH